MAREVVVGGRGVECNALIEKGSPPGVLFLHGYSFRYSVWVESGSTETVDRLGLAWAAPDMPYGRSTSCSSRTFDVDVNIAVARDALSRAGAPEPVIVASRLGARYAIYIHYALGSRGLLLVGPALGADKKAWQLARGLRVPVLIVWGDRDTIVGRSSVEELARRIPNARLEVVEGAGHVVHLDAPRIFNDILEGFLAEVAVKAGQ